MSDNLKDKIESIKGKKIKSITTFEYLGRLCIEEIKFEDGAVIELSGKADCCVVDEVTL